ncbi:MAG: RNA polymerase sigma-70 factor [Bacteroidetes bacterium]|nr:RNA polymerase sigma-70 factor [Bacteroidota bacterium]
MNQPPEIRKEFEVVFKQYYQKLCSYAFTFIKDKESCEDLVQEIFIKIWEKEKMELGVEKIKFYLFTAVRNNCYNKLQKDKKNIIQELQDEDVSEEINFRIENYETEPDPKHLVSNALQLLPPKCKEIFMLSRLSGLTYRQIADSLEISVKTVENQMGKAITILKKFAKENKIYVSILFFLLLNMGTLLQTGVFVENWFYN